MKIKIKRSALLFIALLILNVIFSLFLAAKYVNRNDYDTESILIFLEDKITNTVEKLFFNIQLAESMARVGYENFSQEELDIMLAPIIKDKSIINVSFLPDGIVKYVHPVAGNEQAIGDNIFEMPNRKEEAKVALELREPILCGPYELTQGGTGLIMRKAIFMLNEQGDEEFWGMVSVVMDATEVLRNLDLKEIESAGYAYELSTNLDGSERKIIERSENFLQNRAMYTVISLPNGTWQLGLAKNINISQIATVFLVFLFGLLLSLARYKDLRKKEHEFETIKNEMVIDSLTGLYNRKQLQIFDQKLIEASVPFTLFYIDLNDFKMIKDTYGHDVGDRLLVHVAKRFKQMIRKDDLAIRIGGDEFIVILTDVSSKETINKFCERLENMQKERFVFDRVEILPYLSYGYASFPVDGGNLEEILQFADSKMYDDKKLRKKQ